MPYLICIITKYNIYIHTHTAHTHIIYEQTHQCSTGHVYVTSSYINLRVHCFSLTFCSADTYEKEKA